MVNLTAFPTIHPQVSRNSLRAQFKSRLDALPLQRGTVEQMQAEHLSAFQFNNKIISSFHVGWRPALLGGCKLILGSQIATAIAILLLSTGVGGLWYRFAK